MFIYKFEKGTIKTGVAIDLGTDDEKMFEDNYGKFIKFYDDNKHSKEQLEPVHVFATVTDNDDEYKLVFTKDVDEIARMEIRDEQYQLAWIGDIESMEGNKPINFVCMDGYCTLTEEQYISDGNNVTRSNHISVSWI